MIPLPGRKSAAALYDPADGELTSFGLFIPADSVAICAEALCGGVFVATDGKCPGCGCRQFVLMSLMPVMKMPSPLSIEASPVAAIQAQRARRLRGL